MTPQETFIEVKKDFSEYSEDGYAGGKNGLRCSECDCKYAGNENQYPFLCAMCRAENLYRQAFKAGQAYEAERVTDYIRSEITKRGTYDLNYDDIYEAARTGTKEEIN